MSFLVRFIWSSYSYELSLYELLLSCSEDSTWKYRMINSTLPADNENEDVDTMRDDTLSNLKTKVPQASGDVVAIKQLMQSEAAKNLGLFTRPGGGNEPHLAQIKERIEEWTAQVKNGELLQPDLYGRVISCNCGQVSDTAWGAPWQQ